LALVLHWFDFHLGTFSGVAVAFPLVPVHPFPGRRMFAVMIETIQIGVETVIEPPACLATRGTAARTIVIVAIFGGECRTTMIRKRVASSSYKVT